ncbi:MAG: DsbA family oxidoreductase [Actinobacteria bacterium]|nr:DsbA family oxidoreductase [Actinomycetota bacterium]
MRVEIWSDVVCPWCYIGKRRFEEALSGFAHRDEVEVVWRAFELDPAAPALRDGDYAQRLAQKYRVPVREAQEMIDHMTTAAAGDGLDFNFDIARPGNTFDAHRLLHLASERGIQDAVKERLLSATFIEGQAIGDHETLVRLATEAGLDPDEARSVLDSGAYADEVRADEDRARAYGITGVPFFVVDETYGVSGAQPPQVLRTVLERAWEDTQPAVLVTAGQGEAPGCDGDSCVV